MVKSRPASQIAITEISDPEELARSRVQRERSDRNWTWFNEHIDDIYATFLGKCICVSEGEVFAADTSLEAIAMAKAAHPDDDGRFIFRIPREKAIRDLCALTVNGCEADTTRYVPSFAVGSRLRMEQ